LARWQLMVQGYLLRNGGQGYGGGGSGGAAE